MTRHIAFVGGGNMAYALATRLAERSHDVVVADPLPEQRSRFRPPVSTTPDNTVAVQGASTVVLAVKPQVLKSVVAEIAPGIHDDQLVVSIAAGVPMAAIQRWLGAPRALVRCMPNTPALVGAGISGLIANGLVTADQRREAETILRAAGEVVWFATDADLDAVTALSGSGPAYFFAVVEALVAAGTNIGLDPETAKRLVIATAQGAAIMASDDDPAELRARVTSPGGTTERALSILTERSFPESLDAAVHGAYERARELARELSGESDLAQAPQPDER